MWPVTTEFLTAIASSHTLVCRVEVWRGGVQLSAGIPILDGEVTIDASSRVRRVLRLTTQGTDALFDLLAPNGTQLRPFRGVQHTATVDGTADDILTDQFLDYFGAGGVKAGTVTTVPLGVFTVDEQSLSYAPGGTLTVTAPDLWAVVQRAHFERVRQTAGNAVNDLVDLVVEAVGHDIDVVRESTFLAVAPLARWEVDRDGAIEALASASGVDVAFDAIGRLRIRFDPSLVVPGRRWSDALYGLSSWADVLARYATWGEVLASVPRVTTWTVDASTVMVEASRTRSRQRTFNVVIVKSAAIDGTPPFAPVVVEDSNPNSPTYAAGPFGRVPYEYSSPLVRTEDQARFVGTRILNRVKALASQLSLGSVVNPALEDGDVISVLFPERDGYRRVERYVVDAVTIPLTASGVQQITTRSTRPDDASPTQFPGAGRTWADLYENATWTDVRRQYATWADVLADTRVGGL